VFSLAALQAAASLGFLAPAAQLYHAPFLANLCG